MLVQGLAWKHCEFAHVYHLTENGPQRRVSVLMRDSVVAQALTGGDGETLASTLRGARTGVVQGLAAVSTESAARVNPALLQLQLLDELAAAGEAALPATGLIDLTGISRLAACMPPLLFLMPHFACL